MGKVANHLKSFWESYLLGHSHLNSTQRGGLMRWLLGENIDKLENLTTEELASATHAITNRYRILRNYYLGITPKQAYSHLFNRFGTVMMKYSLLRNWMTASQGHQKTLLIALEGMIEQILRVDPYLRSQQNQIAQCTDDSSLRNALLLTTIEEYCLHSINNYPLLLHLLSNFLRALQDQQQITSQQHKLLQLLSTEIQQKPPNAQILASSQPSPLQQQMRQIAFEQVWGAGAGKAKTAVN